MLHYFAYFVLSFTHRGQTKGPRRAAPVAVAVDIPPHFEMQIWRYPFARSFAFHVGGVLCWLRGHDAAENGDDFMLDTQCLKGVSIPGPDWRSEGSV